MYVLSIVLNVIIHHDTIIDSVDNIMQNPLVLGCCWTNVFMSLPKSRGLIFVELMEIFGSGASLTSFTKTVGAIVSVFGGKQVRFSG